MSNSSRLKGRIGGRSANTKEVMGRRGSQGNTSVEEILSINQMIEDVILRLDNLMRTRFERIWTRSYTGMSMRLPGRERMRWRPFVIIEARTILRSFDLQRCQSIGDGTISLSMLESNDLPMNLGLISEKSARVIRIAIVVRDIFLAWSFWPALGSITGRRRPYFSTSTLQTRSDILYHWNQLTVPIGSSGVAEVSWWRSVRDYNDQLRLSFPRASGSLLSAGYMCSWCVSHHYISARYSCL